MTVKELESGYIHWRKGPQIFAQWQKGSVCRAENVFTTDGLDLAGIKRRDTLASEAQEDYDAQFGPEPPREKA